MKTEAIIKVLRNLVQTHTCEMRAKIADAAIAELAPERKIVQIATAALGNDGGTAQWALGLCNDGTVWQLDPMRSYSGWHSLPPILQDQPNGVQS